MDFVTSSVLIATAGAVCSYIAWRFEHISRSAWFRWGGLALWILLLVLMWSQVRMRSPAEGVFTVVTISVVCMFWCPFMAFFLLNTLVSLVRSALSLDDIRIPPIYSMAEAAVARKELEEALRLYRRTALDHPDDPEPCRRMAEVFLKLERPDDAIRAFREAQEREPESEHKLLLTFAITETLADSKNDPSAATRVLEEFLKRHPDVKGRPYAEERIRALRERLRDRT